MTMNKKIVRVYSVDACEDIGFKKIGKLEHVSTLNADDILLVVDKNGNGNINNVEIRELAKYFTDVNVNAQWYLPKVNGSIISFEWSDVTANHPEPIDILDLIPMATEEHAGLISADNIAKLNKITPLCTECVLNVNGWNPDTLTQKITLEINMNNRNVIDYPLEYNQIVSQHNILAIKEEADGITFKCDTIPTNNVIVYITSMKVIRNAT